MIVGGDEFGRTQQGNNNAYCQDNEISWFNWEHDDWQKELIEFTAHLGRLRRDHPVFRRTKYYQGRRIRGAGVKDIMWLDTDGTEMSEENWTSGVHRVLGVILSGDTMDVRDPHGEPLKDDTFLLLFNAYHEAVIFTLPGKKDVSWELILNTELESGFLDTPSIHPSGEELAVAGRSISILRLVKGSQEDARNTSWRHVQKAAPAEPPRPPAPDRTFRDVTTSGPKHRYDPAKPEELQPTAPASESKHDEKQEHEGSAEPSKPLKSGKHPRRKEPPQT